MALAIVALVLGITTTVLIARAIIWIGQYVSQRIVYKNSWEDEQARYAQIQARRMQEAQTAAWEKELQRKQSDKE